MIDWVLNFVAGLAFISLALIGFVIVALLFMRWLALNTTYSFDVLSHDPENEIDNLRDQTIGDMFDVARANQVQRTVEAESGEQA